jgi:hypothetical protein
MKSRAARIVLLAAALVVAVVPAVSLSASCADEGEGGSCGLDCAVCFCCHGVRTVLPASGGGFGLLLVASVGADAAAAPLGPLPRDVVHVPKSAPSR